MNSISVPGINIESPMHKAAILSAIGIVLGAALIYFMILPLRNRIELSRKEIDETVITSDRMSALIRTTNDKKDHVAELQQRYAALQEQGILTPLLNSYAMRAKTLVQPYAVHCGLTIENVRELPPIPLQQPQPLKDSAFCRQPIEFTASGSYTQLCTFITSVERELPMSILSSLKVTPQQRLPEIHKIQISFEWPTRTGQIDEPPTVPKP